MPRTIRFLSAALITTGLAFSAAAETISQPDIAFEITLGASATDTLADIDAQAWAACAPPAPSSASVLDRSHDARRACQKALVRDVVQSLSDPDVSAVLDRRSKALKG